MRTLTLATDTDVRLSPANSFSPRTAFLYLGREFRLDLDDADRCDELAELLQQAAESLRRSHPLPSNMGRLD